MRLAGFNDVDDRGVRGPGRSAGLLPVLGAAATEGLLYDLAALPRAARRGELASLCAFSLNASALAAVAAGAPWGWKEPRALFHLPAFGLAFPAFRFLHVARDVRSLASAHVEGDVAVMRAWWGDKYAAVVDARRAAISRAAPGGGAPPMACDRLYHDALLWRAVFAEFWAEEQLALVKAGAALGPDRGFHSRDVRGAARRARVGARLRVLAAVKGRCWARADAADAAVAASATVARRARRGYAAAVAKRPRSYSDDAPAPRAAAQDVYAALRPCVDLDCGGGDSPTWAAGGRTCAWVAENPTRARCKVAGDDGAAARDACREACCRPAKPGKG
ncbi:hypothetical protein JL722_12778 [Aureococcus anophagefferens]|nr:hypothetical protein JL722_12778 [Aureococcus anophagefferens]